MLDGNAKIILTICYAFVGNCLPNTQHERHACNFSTQKYLEIGASFCSWKKQFDFVIDRNTNLLTVWRRAIDDTANTLRFETTIVSESK